VAEIRLTPKGVALGLVVEAGFTDKPPSDEQMVRFHQFWDAIETQVIPMVMARMKKAEACEAPASEMD